jgi:chemotaxis signal transduction protein
MAFAPTAGSSPSWAAENAGKIVEYLSFTVGDRDFAVPVASVDRVVAGQPVIGLPRPTAGEFPSRVIGVMELSGRILPVAGPRSCRASDFEGATPPRPDPGAYVIFRGPEGLGAIAVDRIRRVVAVRSDELAPPEAGDDLIAAVAAPAAGERLHIIAPELLWGAG